MLITVRVGDGSTLQLTHQIFAIWLLILNQRDLPSDKLLEEKEVILDDLFTWILLRHLKRACLEIYQEQLGQIIENWQIDFTYDYTEQENAKNEQNNWQADYYFVPKSLENLPQLPEGVRYRVVVEFTMVEGRTLLGVKGWHSANGKMTIE